MFWLKVEQRVKGEEFSAGRGSYAKPQGQIRWETRPLDHERGERCFPASAFLA